MEDHVSVPAEDILNVSLFLFHDQLFLRSAYLPNIRLPAVPSLPDDLGCHPVWCAFHRTKNVALTHTEILKEIHRKVRSCQEMKSKVARLRSEQFFSVRIFFFSWPKAFNEFSFTQ